MLSVLSLRGQLAGFEATERFYEIGSPQGLRELEAFLTEGTPDAAVNAPKRTGLAIPDDFRIHFPATDLTRWADERLQTPQFTAHNIELPDGRQTIPNFGLIAEGGVCQATLRTLQTVFRPEQVGATSVVDLGCLEGGYTVAFARAGFQATGIEVRDLNMAACRYVERELHLDNLRFIQDDARNVSRHGPFDAVFCCGLLYHLDQPRAFLETLSQSTRQVLILQTHVAEDELPGAHASLLSPLTTHEGNLGRWYQEFAEESSPKEVEEARWSSWGNRRSFWIERHHLRQNLLDVGFDRVFEQYDHIADQINDRYEEEQGRVLFVAVKRN